MGKGSFHRRTQVYRMLPNLGQVSENVPQHQLPPPEIRTYPSLTEILPTSCWLERAASAGDQQEQITAGSFCTFPDKSRYFTPFLSSFSIFKKIFQEEDSCTEI